MKKRSETASPMEVEEFASGSGKGVGEIVVDCVSSSISPAEAEAAEAPSRSDVEQLDSKSRSEVDPISPDASSPELRAALHLLCIFRCRTKLEFWRFCLVTIFRDA